MLTSNKAISLCGKPSEFPSENAQHTVRKRVKKMAWIILMLIVALILNELENWSECLADWKGAGWSTELDARSCFIWWWSMGNARVVILTYKSNLFSLIVVQTEAIEENMLLNKCRITFKLLRNSWILRVGKCPWNIIYSMDAYWQTCSVYWYWVYVAVKGEIGMCLGLLLSALRAESLGQKQP